MKGKMLMFFIGLAIFSQGCEKAHEDVTPPPPPSNIWSITGDRKIYLFWDPVNASDLSGYNVYRSTSLYGYYDLIAFTEVPYFVDENVINGETYYYSVSSVDLSGNESQPSDAVIMDTPRPEGSNYLLWDSNTRPDMSGFDFNTLTLTWYSDSRIDFYYFVSTLSGPMLVAGENDLIQDVGPITDLSDIDYAPIEGWDSDGYVPAIPGHGYVLLTDDNHFAAIRVIDVSEQFVIFDWAYQLDPGNRELSIPKNVKISGR